MIEILHLSKSYGSHTVIRNLSLHIEKKEKVAFMAPSGCGKTTLFRLLSGLESPDSGSINANPSMAYIFQEPRLLPEFTVLENVMAVLSGKNKRERAQNWLLAVGMAGHEQKYPDQISGGMAQRTVLARALASEKEIFLLDEPFQGLDDESRKELIALTGNLLKNQTLLLITHDEQEARALCSRILYFEEGMNLRAEVHT